MVKLSECIDRRAKSRAPDASTTPTDPGAKSLMQVAEDMPNAKLDRTPLSRSKVLASHPRNVMCTIMLRSSRSSNVHGAPRPRSGR